MASTLICYISLLQQVSNLASTSVTSEVWIGPKSCVSSSKELEQKQKRNTDLQQEEPMFKVPWGQVRFCSHVFPVYAWVLPRYSSFLSHSKDMHLVLGKLTIESLFFYMLALQSAGDSGVYPASLFM